MINKKPTFNSKKENILIVFPKDKSFLGKMIKIDIDMLYKRYKKTHNIILFSDVDGIKCDGHLENFKCYDVFDYVYYLRFNFPSVVKKHMTIGELRNSLRINKIKDYNTIQYNFETFKNFSNIKNNNNIQIIHNDKDLKYDNIDTNINKIILNYSDYNLILDNSINNYMYYKYGIHNLKDVLYLHTNCFDELINLLPFDDVKVPIEYKEMLDFLKDNNFKLGDFEYIENII